MKKSLNQAVMKEFLLSRRKGYEYTSSEITKEILFEDLAAKLSSYFGCDIESAGKTNILQAFILVIRDYMSKNLVDSDLVSQSEEKKQVHYLSLEFLLGRSLEKNAYNLGLTNVLYECVRDLGYEPADFFELEPDAALGNGGLGRLAACYLDAMTTQDIPATGYSILYEFGIFKQKIIDGEQQELPDKWLEIDDVWLLNSFESSQLVRFGGSVDYTWQEDGMHVRYVDATEIRAIPADMLISGYKTDTVNRLRLWTAQSATDMDLSLFSQGQYMKAMEQKAMAEVITKVLYPEDNHFEGKLLRLRQQYFFVSATIQDITSRHFKKHGTLDNFSEHHAIQINDTHPTFAIPELMRILIDDYRYEWDAAWRIVRNTISYTNHTVMFEALECWPQELVKLLVPRVFDIIVEINRRFDIEIIKRYGDSTDMRRTLGILWDNQLRMANLCIAACKTINGVSELHSEILRQKVFKEAYGLYPRKFVNVTNGIDHRRWLSQANPLLNDLICDLIGDGFLTDAGELERLYEYRQDSDVLQALADIKMKNKIRMASVIKQNSGVTVDPASMFDVQAKRLHEYKRQLLNVMHILYLYDRIKEDSSFAANMQPRTFIFGAKAPSGYHMAKEIIRLINSVAAHVNADSATREKLKVVFLENYRVSLAEKLMPASELSEQISLAGKEASGTGNMKFMINGALTIGTMDGANVEMYSQVGGDNIFIFGMDAAEAETLAQDYHPLSIYDSNRDVHRVIDRIREGFGDGVSYADIVQSLLFNDTYCLLADFQDYIKTQETVSETYANPAVWNRMALVNISKAGYFAADRSIREYNDRIWKI